MRVVDFKDTSGEKKSLEYGSNEYKLKILKIRQKTDADYIKEERKAWHDAHPNYHTNWRQKHPEYSSKKSKQWHKKHPDYAKEYSQKWREVHPDYYKKYRKKKRRSLRKYWREYKRKARCKDHR